RISLLSSLAAVAVALAFTATAGARTTMAHPKLLGAVGRNDAFVITLRKPSGKLVKTIPAGTYTFVIHDYSSLHAFDLDRPHGFSHAFTTVPSATTKTTTLELEAGQYKYYCVAPQLAKFALFSV